MIRRYKTIREQKIEKACDEILRGAPNFRTDSETKHETEKKLGITVGEAIKMVREILKTRKIVGLYLCKGELFYVTDKGQLGESVYPVSEALAAKEAAFLKVPMEIV